MLGLLLTLIVASAITLGAAGWLRRWTEELDPAERIGICGLLGLGTLGLATFLVGLVPGSLGSARFVTLGLPVAAIAVGGLRSRLSVFRFALPRGAAMLFPAALGLLALTALVAVLAPSTTADWDSLAYHLAVPKLFLESGAVRFVQGIHQSNFPATVDSLFTLGLAYGGQSGAKAFCFVYLLLGMVALFGLGRRLYGEKAGWWSALAFAGVPVAIWESGTAYIDAAHGLYAGLGTIYAACALADSERRRQAFLLAGAMLGFAAGSKYTGLQVVFAVGVVCLVGLAARRQVKAGIRPALAALALALALAAPWYVKTAVYTGNPVFPFFSSVLGGRDWDAWRASIYQNEQQSFGVGRTEHGRDVAQIGHAVLGLAYQPGRYVNPGQDQGMGFPTGAIGFAVLVAGAFWAASGRMGARERAVMGAVGVLLLMWFFLSQQSRYLTVVAVPLAALAGAGVSRLRLGPVLAAAVAVQAGYSFLLLKVTQFDDQMKVAFGRVSREDYQAAGIGFYEASQAINDRPDLTRVALYEEVFGYLLDKPYFWANPGHSKLIPYETLNDGDAFADSLLGLGFSHVYVNLIVPWESPQRPGIAARWAHDAGLGGPSPEGLTPEDRAFMARDLNLKWRLLMADAAMRGRLVVAQTFTTSSGRPKGVLYTLLPGERMPRAAGP